MRTVGVEEELLLVDAARSAIVALGADLVAEVEDQDEPPLEHEFKLEQVEIGSKPCESLADLRQELVTRRAVAAEAAAGRDANVVAIATSPWKASPQITPDTRYARMTAEFGLLAREQLTCGQHVHVSIDSRAEGVAVLDRIRVWLPILTALSANSPFWQGQDTDYASFRTVLWGRWPSAGPTEVFGDEARYDEAVAELIRSGAALDDGMIYFDARLSAHYPTVEIRVADVCTAVDDAVLLAALARALVDTAAVDQAAAPTASVALLRGASWRAARWGTAGDLLNPHTGEPEPAWQVIDTLVDHVAPALTENGDTETVAASLARLRTGGGAQRQRAVYARRESLDDVVADAHQRTAQS